MFHSKCGKILSNGTQIINCSDCPCGYFGLFGIKYRQYQFNWETYKYQPQCKWNYYLTIAEIKDNTITLTKGTRHEICLAISRNLGKVGNITKMWDCTAQEDCAEWDWDNMDPQTLETPCLRYQKYWQCQQVIQFQVYNLLGCFDGVAELYQQMGCTAENVGSVIENTWNSYFQKKYLLSFTWNYSVLGVVAWQYLYYSFYVYVQQCYETEDGWQCYQFEDHKYACGGTSFALLAPNDAESDRVSVETGGSYGYDKDWCGTDEYPCYKETCSERVGVVSALGTTGANVMNILADRSKYGVFSKSAVYYNEKGTYAKTLQCKGSNNTCIQMNWTSSCHDNYYWSTTQATWIFRTAEFSVSRTADTPTDAIGVKVLLKRENNKWNSGKGNKSDNVSTFYQEVYMIFDEVYKFPLHTNINTASAVETPKCSEDGKSWVSGGWQISPYCKNGGALENGGDQAKLLGETDNVYIEALQYFGTTGEA